MCNWTWSYEKGRSKRLAAELTARKAGIPFNANLIPLHSFDGTMQSKFKQGWLSVTESDIQCRLQGSATYLEARKRLAQHLGAHHD